ncbi:MAG: histidine kinase [Pyrinomonadaceae bacterium]
MASSVASRRRVTRWLMIFGVWTLFGLFFASQFALQNQLSENPISFWRILSWQLSSGYAWFLASPLIFWLSKKYAFDDGKWKASVPIHVVASIVVSLGILSVDSYVLPKLGYLSRLNPATYWDSYKILFFVNFHFSIAIYWGALAIHQAILNYRKYRERELQTSQLEARLAQSRLQVLKMQLHPHFLFNTLNAISELVHRDPDIADRMLTDLSDLLRMSFENLEVQEIPLKQELEFLRKYLEIEQTRFHDRLEVKMDIGSDTLDASVPNMILQPLVENAIKHGISPRAEGGHINIGASRNNGHLHLSVSDDGVGMPSNDAKLIAEGVGLSNTRRRLKHLYGDGHKFQLTPEGEHGVNVRLDIPYKQYKEVPRNIED